MPKILGGALKSRPKTPLIETVTGKKNIRALFET